MIYQFNEGSIAVPNDLEDRTMHMLVPKPGAINFNLLISHDELEPEENIEQFLRRQLEILARQVGKFEEDPWKPIQLGTPKDKLNGIHLSFRYKQQGKFVYHHQASFPIPDDRHLLTFTVSLPMPFTEEQYKQFMEILKSYSARR